MNQGLHLSPIAAVLAVASMVFTGAQAADKPGYDQAHAAAKSQQQAAEKQCATLAGNARDICKAQAHLDRVQADADAEITYKDSAKTRHSASDAVAKAQYELARERCDDKGGNLKDVCVEQAKAALAKAQADGRAYERSADANAEADKVKRDADYKVELEKCDQFAGDPKAACVNRAKATFGK
jgi:hypothetical protein